MVLRLSLVGFFVRFDPGSLTQLVLGMLTSFVFLLVQMQASPYVHKLDAYLALSCSASMSIFFLCCIIFKVSIMHRVNIMVAAIFCVSPCLPPLALGCR